MPPIDTSQSSPKLPNRSRADVSIRNPREAPVHEAHDSKETGRLRLHPLQEKQDEMRRFEAMQAVHPLWKRTVMRPAVQIFEAKPQLLQ